MEGAAGEVVSCPHPIVGARGAVTTRNEGHHLQVPVAGATNQPVSCSLRHFSSHSLEAKALCCLWASGSVSIMRLSSFSDAPPRQLGCLALCLGLSFTVSDPQWLNELGPSQPQLPGQPELVPSCLDPQQLPLIPTSFCGHYRNVKATSGQPFRVPERLAGPSFSLASAIFRLSAVGSVLGEADYLLGRVSQMAGPGMPGHRDRRTSRHGKKQKQKQKTP